MKLALAVLVSFVLSACTTTAGSTAWVEPAPAPAADDGYFVGRAQAQSGPRLAEAPSEVVAERESPSEPQVSGVKRQVIYSATLGLVVVSAQETLSSIQAIAEGLGGYLAASEARAITVRVPAAQFDAAVQRIAGLGEVVERSIRASDVTEEMLDLGIRLENARRARARLLEHLEKSERMEDTLAIERELARVTEELERLEGRQRYLESQIAMSTIRVELNTVGPQRGGDGLVLPFEWVERLGDGLVAGSVQGVPRKPRFLSRGPYFEPPAGFVRYYSDSDLVEAMDAGGVRLKLQKHDNFDDGALSFWSELARRALVQRRALAVTDERELERDLHLIAGTREVGNETLGYLLVLARTKRDVITFEAWGPAEAFAALRPALEQSAVTLKR